MKKQRLYSLVCALASVCMAFCALSCNKQDKTEQAIAQALEDYLTSTAFTQAVTDVKTIQDRVPLLYLGYVTDNYYVAENADAWQTTLQQIDELIVNDGLSDDAFVGSAAQTTGFESLPSFLYAWSLCYNQNALYAVRTQTAETYASRIPLIKTYIQNEDLRLQNGGDMQAVAWSYEETNILPLIAANLGIENATQYCDNAMLSYYHKENGAYTATAECGNWNGFTGRPLAASLYRNNARYDSVFEKTQQGYYVIDGNAMYPYALSDCVTLDTLSDHFVFTLQSDYGELFVNPQYALLTAMAHGLDMTRYQKTTGGDTADVIALWLRSIQDADGNYAIDNFTDMATAIAYLARKKGVTAPTPLGVYRAERGVIQL